VGTGRLGRKSRKIALYGLIGTVGVLFVAVTLGYWRLSQGPMTIGFLSGPLENIINANLGDMRIKVRDAVIERDAENNTIHLRLREAHLVNGAGQLIARAPRAAVRLSGSALLSGTLQPESLEFIGPRILVRRPISGGIELGFGETSTLGDQDIADNAAADLRGTQDDAAFDVGDIEPVSDQTPILESVFEQFVAAAENEATASAIESISITNAAVSIYDEVNDAIWYAPKTDLELRRVPYGISLLGHGQLASGRLPWRLQIAANYVTETGRFSTTIKVEDLVPSDIADDVFALSDLAKVDVPLNGEAELEFDRHGALLNAHGTFFAGAGHLGFPRYISQSLLVDEGIFNVTYVPETGVLAVEESSLFVGGSRATINGSLSPVRDAEGRVTSLNYELLAQNVSLDTEGDLSDQLSIDHFRLRGRAAIEEGRVDINELVLRAGTSSIEVQGTFLEGPDVPGVFLRGRMVDIPLHILLKLWPPDAVPDARQWIVDHVDEGVVSEATLNVDLTSQTLSAALGDAPIPNDQFRLAFRLKDVKTRYYENLPPLQNARGEGVLRGNEFVVELGGADVALDNGQTISVDSGRFIVRNLTETATPGYVEALFSGETSAMLHLIDSEPLGYATAAVIEPETVGGTATVSLKLSIPLLNDLTFDQVEIGAEAQMRDVVRPDVFNGLGIEGGNAAIAVNKVGMNGRGRVLIAGVETDINWTEAFEPGSRQIEATAVLSDDDRRRLGVDMSSFLRGPLPVRVTAAETDGEINRLRFNADLSKAELRISEIRWRRDAGEGATATFDLDIGSNDAFDVANLRIDGPDHLDIQGDVRVDGAGRIETVNLPLVSLGPGNRFAVAGQRNAQGGLDLRINANSFDARPLLGSVFRTGEGDEAGSPAIDASNAPAVTVQGKIKTLFLHNHEHLSNVDFALLSERSALQQLRLTGVFADSRPIDVTMAPDSAGNRRLEMTSGNAGAVLRAADIYSRVQGGTMRLEATLGEPGRGEVRGGRLRINQFDVVNEAALASLTGTVQRQNNNGSATTAPVNVTKFDRLRMSFVIDQTHFRIVDEAILNGATIGASARGSIGRSDGELNMAGTLTPAYALNAALSNVPILGQALLGGQGQGLIGVTFAVTGTFANPRVTVNPVSALAPGFLKRIFEFGSGPGANGQIPQSIDGESTRPRPRRLER